MARWTRGHRRCGLATAPAVTAPRTATHPKPDGAGPATATPGWASPRQPTGSRCQPSAHSSRIWWSAEWCLTPYTVDGHQDLPSDGHEVDATSFSRLLYWRETL